MNRLPEDIIVEILNRMPEYDKICYMLTSKKTIHDIHELTKKRKDIEFNVNNILVEYKKQADRYHMSLFEYYQLKDIENVLLEIYVSLRHVKKIELNTSLNTIRIENEESYVFAAGIDKRDMYTVYQFFNYIDSNVQDVRRWIKSVYKALMERCRKYRDYEEGLGDYISYTKERRLVMDILEGIMKYVHRSECYSVIPLYHYDSLYNLSKRYTRMDEDF